MHTDRWMVNKCTHFCWGVFAGPRRRRGESDIPTLCECEWERKSQRRVTRTRITSAFGPESWESPSRRVKMNLRLPARLPLYVLFLGMLGWQFWRNPVGDDDDDNNPPHACTHFKTTTTSSAQMSLNHTHATRESKSLGGNNQQSKQCNTFESSWQTASALRPTERPRRNPS